MTIQLQMGLMRTSRFIVLVTLLCVSALISSEERLITEEVFLTRLVDPATGKIDGDMAQLLWVCCKVDLAHLVEIIQDLHIWLPEETSSSTDAISLKRQSLEEENVQKVFSVLHPQVKQTLSDCFRKNNIFFGVSGEESASKIWYAKYIESLFPRPVPRRNMGTELLETFAEEPSPAPAPGSSKLSPVSSPGPGPSASSIPRSLSPAAPQGSFFPPVSLNSVSSPAPGSVIQITKKKTDRKPIIIAVVVTASVTFFVAAVFFLCCTKICRTQRKGRQNDESPLLSLSLSGSGGSSSYPFENSIKGEKLERQSMELGSMGRASKSRYEMYEASSNGRPSNGLPPLKPPPGRANPLPPEPPSSFKPPPGRAGPPPTPPPPASPPTLKPSGGGAPPPPPPALGLRPPPPPAPGPRPQAPSAPGPPPPPPSAPGPPPPPLPKVGVPPPRPPPSMPIGSKLARPPPFAPKRPSNASSDGSVADGDAPKTKLKPFFWDKVLANPDQSMVWHQIKSGSFQFDENMIESLFGYNAGDKNKNDRKKESSSHDSTPQFIQLINPKKAQNLSILLRALNVTIEEVCDAVREGNELPSEFVQTLLKMAPTQEEELKLRAFDGALSQLGPAERFLKGLIAIPFAFKRLEALLFMCSLQEEVTNLQESFATLEVACKELRNSRLFLKLLEAVLKTGNRMNDGTFRGGAQAFKLDTLLKLSDVKGTDGKTTLLHFVVQEIIRSEGVRAARAAKGSRSFNSIKTDDLLEETSHDSEEHYRNLGLEKVSGLSNELENVRKASILDADSLTGTVAKLRNALVKARDFLNTDMNNSGEESGFHETLKSFVQNADVDIRGLHEEEKRIMALVKSTGDYFHGNAGKDEGLHLFVIVRDFLIILDRVCKEVRLAPNKFTKVQKKEAPSSDPRQPPTTPSASEPRQPPSPDLRQPPFPDLHQRLFPAIKDRRIDNSSSDDEGP
ncbi:PREDICTED: formin-like protein 5 [Fragaria vesca subsp. vesca]|uniref:formin-like protein 5 n=1 Tax=Fragaria vesca subsp. vesca TaxID=101020 RepID=UPI0002C2FC01|nr:PREDICTED: formin-like protein 5 [Fragaria vesca subsp. vesca]